MPKDRQKPEKPRPDLPLFPHPNGQWCKKIRGKQYFFGVWADHASAEGEYDRVKGDLQVGRKPRPADDTRYSMADLANRF